MKINRIYPQKFQLISYMLRLSALAYLCIDQGKNSKNEKDEFQQDSFFSNPPDHQDHYIILDIPII